MPFKQTNDPSATYCFNVVLTVGDIVTVGKVGATVVAYSTVD